MKWQLSCDKWILKWGGGENTQRENDHDDLKICFINEYKSKCDVHFLSSQSSPKMMSSSTSRPQM